MIKLVFSFDDAHLLDQRTAGLLEKYGFTGIFYVPSNPLFDSQSMGWREIRALSDRGHTIGGHTVAHPMDLKECDDEELKFQIEENRTSIHFFINGSKEKPLSFREDQPIKPVHSFCYPRGRFDERVKKAVKDAGYKEARTTKVGVIDFPTDPYETDTTLHLFGGRKEYDADLLTMFKRYLALALEKKEAYFHIWGHSKEVNENNHWEDFEEMLKILAEKRDEGLITQ